MRPPFARTLLLILAALPAFAGCDRFQSRPKTAFSGDSALSYARHQVAFSVSSQPAHPDLRVLFRDGGLAQNGCEGVALAQATTR